MQNYRILSKKGEGTFSEVMVGVCLRTQVRYAIKCMKRKFESLEDVNKLPEIQALRRLSRHPNIIRLHDVLFARKRLALVLELMDMNLYEAIKDRKAFIPEQRIVSWMHQLLQALAFMHANQLFHRDVKQNLLLQGSLLKLADLGSCSWTTMRDPPFTEYISTRWYRAPECLLTSGFYGSKMDIWATGCVLYEVATLQPLFPGKNELDQVHKIHSILGSPSDNVLREFRSLPGEHLGHIAFQPIKGSGFGRALNHCSSGLVSLISSTLTYDPTNRPTATECLNAGLFSNLRSITKVARVYNRSPEPISALNTRVKSPDLITPVLSAPDVPPLPSLKLEPTFNDSKVKSRFVEPQPTNRCRKGPLTERIIPNRHLSLITTRKPNPARYRNFTRIYRINPEQVGSGLSTHR